MKLKATTDMCSDATTWYELEGAKGLTVKDVRDFALSGDWFGKFEVKKFDDGLYDSVVECDYRAWNDDIDKLSEDILAKKVDKVEANGGWGRMDFYVWMEKEEMDDKTRNEYPLPPLVVWRFLDTGIDKFVLGSKPLQTGDVMYKDNSKFVFSGTDWLLDK